MSQHRESRRHAVPTCFRVVPLLGADEREASAVSMAREHLRDRLAEAEAEARQNWTALIETRVRLTECRGMLEAEETRNEHMRNRIRRLRGKVRDQRSVVRALDGHAERIAQAERTAVDALILARETPASDRIRSVRQALDVARERLPALSVPDEVAHSAAAELDRSGRRKSRGRAVFNALEALHAYAIDAARGANFKQWCQQGGDGRVSYAANNVAMDESRSVRRSERMLGTRSFLVDPALDRSGRRIMTAHIRIDQGETAPRLYFLDDTSGHTGKVHIGYIGPHLPTATDPT